MWKVLLTVLCLAYILPPVSGCAGPAEVIEAGLGEEFTLPIGEEAVITGEDLRISFEEVTEDSRCPKNVECVWEGQARYALLFTLGEASERAVLTEPGAGGQAKINVFDYEVKAALEPYPQDPGDIEVGDYMLRMSVMARVSTSSMAIIGEWKPEEGTIAGVATGEINGTEYLFLTTIAHGVPYEARLHVLDVSEPEAPVEVSRTEALFMTWIPVVQPALTESTLYLPFTSEEESGLCVLDISDPTNPRESARVLTEYGLSDLEVSDGLLCAATFPTGSLLFFDISEPESPRQTADAFSLSRERPPVSYREICFGGPMLYASDAYGMTIIDVSDPSSPHETGFHANPDWMEQKPEIVTDIPESGMIRTRSLDDVMDGLFPSDVYLDIDISGQYAYIAASGYGLQVIDITDPEHPAEAARLDIPGRVNRVAISGNFAYLLETDYLEDTDSGNVRTIDSFYSAVRIVDISDPTDPVIADAIEYMEGIPVINRIGTGVNNIFVLIYNTVRVLDIYAE
jgi:hypothetical protein